MHVMTMLSVPTLLEVMCAHVHQVSLEMDSHVQHNSLLLSPVVGSTVSATTYS